jgi:hypothetical protein
MQEYYQVMDDEQIKFRLEIPGSSLRLGELFSK